MDLGFELKGAAGFSEEVDDFRAPALAGFDLAWRWTMDLGFSPGRNCSVLPSDCKSLAVAAVTSSVSNVGALESIGLRLDRNCDGLDGDSIRSSFDAGVAVSRLGARESICSGFFSRLGGWRIESSLLRRWWRLRLRLLLEAG